jgi:UDP-N-acetylmuramoyl-tripeptide--D-alanyl-D-alanine ligase
VRAWSPERVAEAAGARLIAPPPTAAGPQRAVVDSRSVSAGDLFVGLPGERVDGGRFAAQALAAGAWGVLVAPDHAEAARCAMPGVLLAAPDPLAALGRLARAWRRELACPVVGITGSVGKTSTKDLLAAMLAPARRTIANRENWNTEIGLPLTVLAAPAATEVLVLEMGMRGPGQVAELAAIAEPDVGVITSVGPVHLELMGSLEAIAAAKAELIAALPHGGTAVVPAGEALLEPYLRADVSTVTFGPGGDVATLPGGLAIGLEAEHMRRNALAALAAARALGVEPSGEVEVELSSLRGQRTRLPGGVVVIDDCYNANPMSMQAALADLAATARGRRVAVLGDMLELGPDERRFHAELGHRARDAGVDVLVTVGPLAAEAGAALTGGEVHAVASAAEAAALVPGLLRPGDTVLVKGSRGVGLEVVAEALRG